ncbi:MAG: DUF4093 domain-containing protein [Oscillospiraceae bacterium]|nr:DUF4093 domain-containing protein [Oscillospiraceae bacterium]
MLAIREAIVVEGKYDKNTLSQLVDTLIIPTDGFGIFKDGEKKKLLRKIAQTRGLILLTDSDGAGFVIRNHLKGVLPKDKLKQAYIPDIYGKERRKTQPGKEGKLGVEGMSPQVLEKVLRQAGATILSEEETTSASAQPVTKADFLHYGLAGTPDSARRRETLKRRLELPSHLTSNGLLEVINTLFTRQEFEAAAAALSGEDLSTEVVADQSERAQ